MLKDIPINPLDLKKETLNFLEQARIIFNIIGDIPASYSDIITHLNLLMVELSLKSLLIFYLGKYQRTHFFEDEPIIKKLILKLNPPEDIIEAISKYRKMSPIYYFPSRYNQTNLNYSNNLIREIDEISEKIFNFTWKNLNHIVI